MPGHSDDGNATVDTAIEAVKAGALDYLTKPLDLDRLARLLSTVREGIHRRERCCASTPRWPSESSSRHDRPQPGDAGAVRLDPPSGAARADGADHRRDRHRQGTGRARAPRSWSAAAQAVRHGQLLGGRRDAARERAVRPRARRVHRRDRHQGRRVRARRRRTLFLDEVGELPLAAGEAAARGGKAKSSASGRSRTGRSTCA